MSKFIEQVKSIVEGDDQAKIDTMIMNYKIDDQRFEDAFELIKYRLTQDN